MSAATQQIIRGGVWVGDEWISLATDEAVPPGAKIIVDYERFTAGEATLAGADKIGVRLPNTLDVIGAWPALSNLPLITLEIPKFGDGRAYSQASLLRERCGFTGELRAVGDVLVDQLLYLQRCGFDVLVPRADQDPDDCLHALRVFSTEYQSAADAAQSVWQRRRSRAFS